MGISIIFLIQLSGHSFWGICLIKNLTFETGQYINSNPSVLILTVIPVLIDNVVRPQNSPCVDITSTPLSVVLGLFKDYVVIPVLIFPALRFQGWNAVRKSSTPLRWSVLSAWWDWKISLSSFYFVPFLLHITAVSHEKTQPRPMNWSSVSFSRLQAFIKSLSLKDILPLCHFPSLILWSANYMSTYILEK